MCACVRACVWCVTLFIRQSQQTCNCAHAGVCTELIVLSAWAYDSTAQIALKLWFRWTEPDYYLKPRSRLCHSHTLVTSWQSPVQTFHRDAFYSPSSFWSVRIKKKADLQITSCSVNDLKKASKQQQVWLNLVASVSAVHAWWDENARWNSCMLRKLACLKFKRGGKSFNFIWARDSKDYFWNFTF